MAVKVSVQFRKDLRQLDLLERMLPSRLNNSVKAMADGAVTHMRNNWSPSAPSSPGNPPAVRTGDLDASMVVEQARGRSGRFESAYVIKFTDPATGALEFGYAPNNLAARPFIRPALEAVGMNVKDYFDDLFSFMR